MKMIFQSLGGLILIVLVSILAVQGTKYIILALFPSLMQVLGLSDTEMSLFVMGVMIILLVVGAFIYNSINREVTCPPKTDPEFKLGLEYNTGS